MKINFEESKIFVRPGATDLRKGISGLCVVIENEMNLDVQSGAVFLFCNRQLKLLKYIFWDRTGFWLAQKRLERATWSWHRDEEAAREIKAEQSEKYEREEILGSSKTAEVIKYCLKNWSKLIKFLECSFVKPDTNAAERAIKPFVMARKTILFSLIEQLKPTASFRRLSALSF